MSTGNTAEVRVEKSALERRGIPEHGLPIWETLPLWAKLPVPPAPKDAFFLTTTDLCEKIRVPSEDDPFDLTDPDVHQFSNEYQSMHDPHLKYHLGRPRMQYRLFRSGYITSEGKVLCTLREYNEYRKYLRRQQWQTQVLDLRKQDEQQLRYINKQKQQFSGNGLCLNRDQKMKEVGKRIQHRLEQDRERYCRILDEEEARREKIRLSRLERLNEQERKRQEEELKRRAVLKKKDDEERRKKLLVYAKLTKEDEMFRIRTEERRRRKEYESRKKLDKMWEERKRQQTLAIRANQERRVQELERQKQWVMEYTSYMYSLQRRREERLVQMQEDARVQRLEKRENYATKLQKSLRKQRSDKRAEWMRSRRTESRRQSNWDWTISLEHTIDMSMKDLRIKTGAEDIELQRKYSTSELGLFDLRGANFDNHVIDESHGRHRVTSSQERLYEVDLGDLRGANLKKRLYGRLLNDPRHGTANVDKLLKYIWAKYRGADMKRITRAIRDKVLEDKHSQTNELGLEDGMFPEQGKVPEELSVDEMGHVPILKHIAALRQEETIGPKESHSGVSISVKFRDDSEEEFGSSPHSYNTPPFSRELNETMSELHAKVTSGVCKDIREVAGFIVGWCVNIAVSVVHPASHLRSSDMTISDTYPTPLSSVYLPVERSSSESTRSTSRQSTPYRDTALHMSLLGIGDRHRGDQDKRRSLQYCDNTLGVPCSTSDYGPMSRLTLQDSRVLTKSRLRPGPSYTGGGINSIEDLIGTLTSTLADVRAGCMSPDQIEKLRVLATGILESAAVLADGVKNFVDEHEQLLRRRSSLLIEALVSDTMDQLMEDVKENTLTKTSSRLVADLVNYTLNEALDDSMRISSDKLARIDSILVDKFITDNLHDALEASRSGRPTAEAMLLQTYVRNAIDHAKRDLERPDSEIEANVIDVASTIVHSIESLREQDGTETPREPSNSDAALSYVSTVLDNVLRSLRAREISPEQAREMAIKMGVFDEAELVITDEDISSLVEAVLAKTMDELDTDLADRVVTEILSDAAFLASEIGDGYLMRQAGLEVKSRAVSDLVIVGKGSSAERMATQSTPDLLEGLVRTDSSTISRFVQTVLSDMVIKNFVAAVISGTFGEIETASYSQPTSQTLLTSASLSEAVVNTFLKKVLNSALEGLPPSTNEPDAILQFVSGIIDKSHSFTETQSYSNIAQMADDITEQISALSLVQNPCKTTDSCPAIVNTPTPTKDGAEPHGLTTSQQHLIQNAESLHQHTHLSGTDESSEEELPEDYVDIHPVFKGEEVQIEHDHAVATLGAISVKHFPHGSHLMHNEAIPRNSFSNLTRPDLSALKSLQNKSLNQVKDKLEHVYQRSQLIIAKKEQDLELETLSDDENDDTGNESTESEAEVVLATDDLDEVKVVIPVQTRPPVDGGSRAKISIEPTNSNENSASKKLSKEKSSTKTVSKSKEAVKNSESKKSATTSGTNKLVETYKRKSTTDRKASKTSSTGGGSSSKLRRSRADLTLKKSLERDSAIKTDRSTSDVGSGGPVVKSVRSVDGTFSSKVAIRSTRSTDDTTNEQTAPDVLATSTSQGIIMENDVDTE